MENVWRKQFDKLNYLWNKEMTLIKKEREAWEEYCEFKKKLTEKVKEFIERNSVFKINWKQDKDDDKKEYYEVEFDKQKVRLVFWFWDDEEEDFDYQDVDEWNIDEMEWE